MMTTYARPPVETKESRSLWWGLLAGPLIWIVYFLAGYGLVEFACKLGLLRFNLGGLNALSAAVIGLTVVALLVTLWTGFLAYRRWRYWQNDESDPPEPSREFMSLAGVLLSGLFALTILLTGLPVLILRPC